MFCRQTWPLCCCPAVDACNVSPFLSSSPHLSRSTICHLLIPPSPQQWLRYLHSSLPASHHLSDPLSPLLVSPPPSLLLPPSSALLPPPQSSHLSVTSAPSPSLVQGKAAVYSPTHSTPYSHPPPPPPSHTSHTSHHHMPVGRVSCTFPETPPAR